ncbi:MAG: SDR family NAD(P)-dependent oxidoreductase [Verrucomicrobiota bacterium]
MKNEPSIQQLFDLSGRVALITGASGHLGASMANALAEASMRVVVASRDAKTGKMTAGALKGTEQGRHLSVVMDHMDEQSVSRGFDEAARIAGKIDVLICNGHEPLVADWRSVTAEQFNRQLQNVTGYFLLPRKMREHAVHQASPASIIMIGSMYGLVGSYPDVYEDVSSASPVAYHALKGGMAQMVRHIACR